MHSIEIGSDFHNISENFENEIKSDLVHLNRIYRLHNFLNVKYSTLRWEKIVKEKGDFN